MPSVRIPNSTPYKKRSPSCVEMQLKKANLKFTSSF